MDYGNRSQVDLDLLMEIPCQLLELPFQVRQEAAALGRCELERLLEVTQAARSPRRGARSLSGKGLAWSHRPNLISAFFQKCIATDIFVSIACGVS